MAFLTPDRTYTANGVTVKEYLLTKHNPNNIAMPAKRNKPLLGVTIHNTDTIRVSGTTMSEQYTRATYNGNMNTVRVHFYVDDTEAWQNLPLDRQGWHAADGSGDGNTATIAIECIMSGKNTESDRKAEENAARLAAWLLSQYNMSVDKLYTHTYWLNVRDGKGVKLSKDERCTLRHPYKVCPLYIIPHWGAFVNKVSTYLKAKALVSTDTEDCLYYIVVGVYAKKENALKMLEKVKKYFADAFIKAIRKG